MNKQDPNASFLPEDSLGDPELGFGEDDFQALPMEVMEPMPPLVHDVNIETQPEAETLSSDANVPLDVEQEVCRLDVTMNDSLLMRISEAARRLQDASKCFGDR